MGAARGRHQPHALPQRDAQLARGQSLGWMHGFPMAIKELSPVAGLPLSMGSPLLALGDGSACEHCAMRGLCRRDHWHATQIGRAHV